MIDLGYRCLCIPQKTTVTFFYFFNPNSVNYQSAYAELTINRGYGNGSSLEGTLTQIKCIQVTV